jgi:hypothetical protein
MNPKKTLFFIAVFNIFSLFFFHNWNDYPLQNGDSFGYYNYLPALFIHHDLIDAEGRQSVYARHKNHSDHIHEDFTPADVPKHWLVGLNQNGRQVNLYTCGVAMLQTPFFLTAHVLAQPFGYKKDGFSLPYRFGIALSGCCYTLLGLLFLMLILRGLFDDTTTSITLLIVGLATNLYYFSTYNPFMSHNHLFTLVAILMWSTIQFYKTFERKYLFLMAFMSGFIAIMRQTDAIFLVIPVFYQIYSWQTLRARLQLIADRKLDFLIAIVCFVLPILPQLLYWKLQTGNWIFNSYGDLMRFDFQNPKIIKGLFYFSNGWLAYTPVMVLAILGISFMFKKRDFLLPILLFLPIYVFVIYSWWCWNYINGFGSRPMIDGYALLAIPLGMSVDFIRKLSIWLYFPLFLLVFAFGLLNIWQTEQVNLNILRSEDGSLAYVWNILPKTKLDYDALIAFDSKSFQPTNPTFLKKVYENNFEDSITSPNAVVREKAANGLVSYRILPNTFSAGFRGKVADFGGAKWMRLSVKAFAANNNFFEIYQKTSLVGEIRRGDDVIEWQNVLLENKLGESDKLMGGKTGVWGEVSFYIKIPKNALPTDNVQCMVWCNNIYPIVIDDLKVEAWK